MAEEKKKLEARVLTPEGEIFRGEVVQLSTRTVVGEIGILADHVPLLARLVPCELRLHISEGETRTWAQAEGWLEVFGNRALALIGEAVPPEQLDQSELRDRLADAEQRVKESEEGSAARERAERDVQRTEAFLEVAGKQ